MTLPAAPRRLTIATRESALAMWQAEHIRARLAALYPECEVGLVGITTQGDRIIDQPLADIGGKGLFIKELEVAMTDGRADLAVHSLKDVPMEMPAGFTLAAIGAREDPRDAFVSNHYLDLAGLPGGARVGTSSLRREAQLRERDPLLQVLPLRGNVNTRLRKLDEGQYEAIILAAAGLKRLGFGQRIASLLDPEESLPAVGQGALALECRADRADVIAALSPLADRDTMLATTAERAFSRALAGSCHTPLAAHAVFRHDELWLRGLLASRDGAEVMRGEKAAAVADADAADALGLALADDFLARGAGRLCGVTAAAARVVESRTSSAPLAGIGVLVTRPARQAGSFAQKLAALGATPIIFPAIAILPPADPDALSRAHAALADYDIAVFVSANAVEYGAPDPRRWPAKLAAFAPGPGTAEALAAVGIGGARIPATTFDSEGLLALPELAAVGGKRVVIFRGDGVASVWVTRSAHAARPSSTSPATGARHRRQARQGSRKPSVKAASTPSR